MRLFTTQRRGSAGLLFVVFGFLFGIALSSAAQAADLYVAPGGTDSGACTVQATPCQSITYAITQAVANDHINIAAGQYINPLTITTDGLQLLGEDVNHKPRIQRIAGGVDQPLLVISGAKNVHVENLEFDMDQSFVGEGILAAGFVDGLTIANNYFVQSRTNPGANSHYRVRNAISINDSSNSQGLPLAGGSNVNITGNTIDGAFDIPNDVFLHCGVDMDAGIGTIANNTITAVGHDIRVRFATATTSSTAVSISDNHLFGRGLEFAAPNNSTTQVTISGNDIHAIAGIDGSTAYPADFSLMRLIDNAQDVLTTISGNQFLGHQGSYRGVLIENYPGIQLTSNTFTPAAGVPYFVSLVVSNKEITTDNPPQAPLSMNLTAQDNTFNGSGVAGAGAAVEFLNDNDAGGTANFGSLLFGGSGTGEANHFDGQLGWYFHLDDYSCDHAGSSNCSFLNYPGVGTIPDTQVRPFTGNVNADDNTFGGLAPADMDGVQTAALLAKTYDARTNNALGTVDYGLTAAQSVVYVDPGFSGNYGDSKNFAFANPTGACAATTANFGIDAFATISDGLMHVVDGGTVCVAKGAYAETLTLSKPVQLVGDGNGLTDTVLSQGITVAASGVDSTHPLLIQTLRVSDPISGHSGITVIAESHLAFRGVALVGNGDSGINLSQDAQDITIADSLLDGNTSGLRTASATHVADVAITNTTFSNNTSVGLILFGASNGTGSATNWSIDQSQFLSNDNTDTTAFGGGIWIDTFGQTVDGFHVTNSSFADNGSDSAIQFKRGGINVLAISGVMKNVSLCTNAFTENTGTSGTQKNGIVVYDGTNNTGYQPITVCADNTFSGTNHSISGISQFQFNGTQPVVDITGGAITNSEYINGLVRRIHLSVQNGLFPTITAAMNDPNTVAGDEIQVPAGIYHENVVVSKSVILNGPFAVTAGYEAARNGTGEAVINPPAGKPLYVKAADAIVAGFTFDGATRGQTVVTNTSAATNLQFINNRITNVVGAAGILTAQNTQNWTIAHNLFKNFANDYASPIQYGQAIKYLRADGGLIEDNVFIHVQSNALQVEQNTGSIQILNNRVDGQAAYYTNVGLQLDGNSGATVLARDNTFTNTQLGLLLGNGSSSTTTVCNRVTNSNSGLSTQSLSIPTFGTQDAGRVFHNSIYGNLRDVRSTWLPGALVVGSNFYGGAAPTTSGNAAQIATALPADPFGNQLCGNNTTIGAVLAVSGTPQTTDVNTPFAAPLEARVVDQLGGSIAGASVAFTAPGSGASAVLGVPSSGTADFDGRFSTTATANGNTGSYSVIASSGAQTAAFALTNAGAPNVALTLNGPASAVAGTATPGYTAQLSNTGSNLSENVLVDFVISRSAGLTPGDITLEYDTGSGYASIPLSACNTNQLCGSFGPPGIGFPVGPSYNSVTALRFTSIRSGAISLAATVDGVISHTAYASSGMTVTVSAQATNIAANGATIFTGDAGQPLGALPSVIVTDGNGNPAPGVSVTFATSGNSGTLSGATQVTNSNGIATLGGWTLSSTPGTNTVTATASGLAGSPVTFTASTPNVSITFNGDAQALVTAATDPYTPFVDYTVTLGNSGVTTLQTVHYAITVVRIDDGNSANPGQPMAIDADDVQVCVDDPTGGQADNKGCPTNWESLFYSESTGAFNGRPAVTFRYPINPIYDNVLPTIDPAQPLPGVKLRFKHGDYQMHVSVIGDSDGFAYATASGETTVPNAAIAYNGPTSGQAEDILLSQTTLTNTGGRVQAGNVIVSITLSDTGSATLAPADAEFDYQLGATYQTLPWTQSGNDLVTYFGQGTGFPLEDGHNATTAGRAIFHREGSYSVLYEVLDAATFTPIYASQTITPITIGANMASFSLSDLNQVYDGGPHAVTVTSSPSGATSTTVYEALVGSSCPAASIGSDTTPPTNAGSYCVYVTGTGSYSGSATGTLVVAKAVATVSITGAVAGEVNRTYTGNPQVVAGTATATPAPTGTVTLTYNGDANAPTDAGSYSLVATLNDPNYTGVATGTLVVATATGATITLDVATLNATFDGQPHAVTATTVPAGVSYAVTYVGDGSTSYPLTMTPPSAVGHYHVVATTTDPNYDQVSASGTLTIAAVNASLTLAGDPVGAVADASTPLYSLLTATTNVSGAGANENVLANLIITRSGGATAGDVDVDYLAVTQESPSCVAATSGGFWCPLSLIDNGDGTLSASFGAPGTGFPLTDGATSYFRTAYHRGGQYAVSTSIDGVSTGETYASGTQTIEVAQLNLHNSGPATGSTGVNVDTTSTLTNTGTAAISTATAAPNNENVIGLFEVAIGSGTVSGSDLTVTYLAPDDAYYAIPLTACTGAPTHLCGEFGGAGFPVAAGYDATSLFRTTFTRDGSYTFNVSIVGASSHTIFATTSQAITVAASTATIAFDPASLNQVYNTGTHPVIVTTTPTGLSYSLTYDDGTGPVTTPPTNAGDYTVIATITQPGYTGTVNDTLHVAKATATVAISNITQTYDGSEKHVTVTTDPAGLVVDVTYNGGAAPTAVGTYAVVATVNDPNYTGSSSATLQIVAAPTTDLAVSINDARDYVQYGKTLIYRIVVSNLGNTNVAGATISDLLPPEIDGSSSNWICVPLGSATCGASGSGDLSDTFSVPAGGGLVYFLTATVRSDAAVPTEQIVNMVSITVSGDTNLANNSATGTTQIVIFRDGFEQGGDGAQANGAAMANSVGTLDDVATLMLDPASAPQAINVASPWLRATDASGREVFRIDSLRTATDVLVRVISSDANGDQSHSQWIALGMQTVALALADTSADKVASTHALILLGAKNASLQMAIPTWATLPLGVYSAQ